MTDETNGRITMAVLGEKIDALTKQVQSLTGKLEQVSANQVAIASMQAQQHSQEKDIEGLNTRVNGWSAINSAGAILAAILGIFVNPNK